MYRFVFACVLLLASVFGVAAADLDSSRTAYLEALRSPDDDAVLDRYLATLPQVASPLPGGNPLYVVEGDMLQTRAEVRALLRWKTSAQAPKGRTAESRGTELVVNLVDNEPTYWRALTGKESRVLRYAVIRSTFPDDATYAKVVDDMRLASQDWMDACPQCGVVFEHVGEHDAMPNDLGTFEELAQEDTLRFVVAYVDSKGAFLAAAFFPNDPINRRFVQIDPGYFDTTLPYDGRGMLRHELGHVLGYRHEHIQAEAGCWKLAEGDAGWKPFTAYDRLSVMHYMCEGGGTQALTISTCDAEGHRKLYAGIEPVTCAIKRD
jgi:hypothetical protein